MRQFLLTMITKSTIFISILIISLSSFAFADSYYIATSGNDSNNGSLSSPWRTIKHAWRNSGGGDTVFIRGGTYSGGEIWLQNSNQGNGIANQFWTLKAYSGEVPNFTNARFIIDADYVRVQGLYLTGSSFIQSVSWGGMHDHIEFIDNDISGSPTVPLYFMANNGLVQGNKIRSTSAVHGIYVMHGDGNIVRDNYVSGIKKYGIHVYDENKYGHAARITNLLVENNTVIGSQSRSGIIISAGESTASGIEIDGVVIRNNIVINNGEDGITIRYYGRVRNVDIFNNVMYGNHAVGLRIIAHDVDNVTIKNNIFVSNGTHIDVSSRLNNLVDSHNLYWQPSSIGSGATDDYAVYQDPLFVNVADYDFHLREDSPAIDVGVEVGIPYNGAAPDLGAFEYGLSSSVEANNEIPRRYRLQQNYPNPFNPETEICYFLPGVVDVDLSIFDISGKHVITLVKERQIAGNRAVRWNGRDKNNVAVSSGVYFYRLTTNSFSITKKMLLVR